MAWGGFCGGGWTASQVTIAASTAAVLGLTLYSLRRRLRPTPGPTPDAWRRTGTLTDLTCYPIKSCGGVRLLTSRCSLVGLQNDFLRDRVFMVVRENGTIVTGLMVPKLTQIAPSIEGSTMTLRMDGMPDITFDIADLPSKAADDARVSVQTVGTVDCGDAVSSWLSRALLSEGDVGMRLAFFPGEVGTRVAKPRNAFEKMWGQRDMGAFPDEAPYCLMASASVADLNSRLERPVPARQFRANFLVETGVAFEEDSWDWVRIGEVVFQKGMPCTRCMFTTVDPDTGMKSKDSEPLKTLQGYRKLTDPAMVRLVGSSPALGIYLTLVGSGQISVGDPVFVQ